MLFIKKQTPPACINALQKTPGADWGSVTGTQKDAMRRALLAEQGFLCAYCMRTIENDREKCTVEHWRPRSLPDTDPFHWRDLLAVCDGGGPGAKPDAQHCDRKRGDTQLSIHPAQSGLEEQVSYQANGTISVGGDEREEILNLNLARMKRNRQVISDLCLEKAGDIQTTRQLLQGYRSTGKNGQRREYAGIAIYFLEKRLKALEDRADRTKKNRVR